MEDLIAIKEKIHNLKVLFVDDEPDIRASLGALLKRFFDNVVICSDGVEALEEFKKTKDFDVVISDMLMPKMNGKEMVQKIREIDSNVFTVFITASREIVSSEKQEADFFVEKPISFDDLLSLLKKIAKTLGK